MRENFTNGLLVYIIKCKDGTLYTGITTDLVCRIKQHNGEVKGDAAYTRGRRPVTLCYSKMYRSRGKALKEEYVLKNLSRKQKIFLIEKA